MTQENTSRVALYHATVERFAEAVAGGEMEEPRLIEEVRDLASRFGMMPSHVLRDVIAAYPKEPEARQADPPVPPELVLWMQENVGPYRPPFVPRRR